MGLSIERVLHRHSKGHELIADTTKQEKNNNGDIVAYTCKQKQKGLIQVAKIAFLENDGLGYSISGFLQCKSQDQYLKKTLQFRNIHYLLYFSKWILR